jgi:hypothetical protein
MKNIALALVLLILAGSISGCATAQLKSTTAPGADLKSVKKLYVVHLPQDGREIDRLIADRLNLMGREATHGERSAAPTDADAIVTYQDKWMWDITMYLIELNVQLRHPTTDIAMASGHSLRTSLVRKSPPEMIEEVLTDMFK